MGRGEVGGRLLEVLIRKVAQLRQLGDPLAFALDKEGPRRQISVSRSCPKSTTSLSICTSHFSIYIIESTISLWCTLEQ
jgi:hypothetical protein